MTETLTANWESMRVQDNEFPVITDEQLRAELGWPEPTEAEPAAALESVE